jgi:hypothetical protein
MEEIDLEKFLYCRKSGHFFGLRESGLPTTGRPIRQKKGGYVVLDAGGKRVYAHRAAWRIVYGEWPSSGIDHINGDKSDNRITNLRLATQAENMQNLRKPGRRNKSGFLGVSWDRVIGLWLAQITAGGINYQVGWYETPEEASAAYKREKMRLHPFYAEGLRLEAASSR